MKDKIKGKSAKEWLEEGFKNFNKNYYQDAIECFQNAFKLDPKNTSGLIGLGDAYYELENYKKAIEFYENVVKIDSQNIKTWLGMGSAYMELENYQKELECYKKAEEINPQNSDVWYYMGLAYNRLKNYQEAIECCEKALKLDPQNLEIINGLNLIKQQTKKGEGKSIKDLLFEAQRYFENENFHSSIKYYEKVIKIYPQYSMAWQGMGVAYSKLNNNQKAIKCFEKAVELYPDNKYAWNNMGNAYDDRENNKKAIECYQKAIKIDSKYNDALFNLGVIYRKLGYIQKAIACFEKVKENNPYDIETISLLGNLIQNQSKTTVYEGFEKTINLERPKIDKSKRLLGMIKLRKKISIDEAAEFLGITRKEVESLLFDLVGENKLAGRLEGDIFIIESD